MSRKVLTTPYIVWGAAFIILPLIYGAILLAVQEATGSFTLSNITAMAVPFTTKRSGILSGLR